MAGVFKNLDSSDIRLTPFQTHKKWNDAVCYTNYYSTVNARPASVSGLVNVADRAFATDISSSRVLRLDSSDNYTVLSSYSVPRLSGSRYGFDGAQAYIEAYGSNGSFATVSMLSSGLTLAANGAYTSSIVTVPYDVSYNVSSSTESFIYVAGTGGISGRKFNVTTGAFSGTEHTITNLANQSLTSSFYAVNAEGKGYNDRILAVSVTGTSAFAVTLSGSFATNTLVVAGSSSLGSSPGVLPQTFLYSKTQDLYFLLMQNGSLYKIQSNASSSLLVTGVAEIVQDKSNYVSGSATYQDTNVHVIYQTGEVGLDLYADTIPGSFDKIVDARQWVARKPIVKGTIQRNIASGSIGIFAGTTSSLDESVFFTINPDTYEISDPIHMGATKGDLRIAANNLNNFIGFSSSYNNRFVQFDLDTATFQHYKTNYNPQPSHPSYNPLDTLFDQGNPTFQYFEPITANQKFQRVVHQSINHLFYQHFYNNTKATFGGGNINTQDRFIEDQTQVINLPQSKFGEYVQQGSVTITANYCVSQSNNTELTIVDDIYGNLYVSGGFVSAIDGTTLITGSVSASTVGEWPTLDLYKYNTKGFVTFTSSFNKGNWQMQTNYSNVRFADHTGSLAPIPQAIDLLGVVPNFSSSVSSSIIIQPGPVQDYKQNYNFENGDFTITMMLRASATSSHASGSIIIAKEGPALDDAVDLNGNVYTYNVDKRSPYRISLSGSYEVVFERDNLLQQAKVSGSITQNKLHHITAMKTGSEIRLYVDGVLVSSAPDVLIGKGCSNKANITIGNLYTYDRGFDGFIDNVKMYKQALTPQDIQLSYHTLGVNNTTIGNIMYTHGMMVLGAVPARYMDIKQVSVRGTHTIWEKEVSCTIGAGEFNRSNNPTLQEYNPATNQYEFRPFTTGSFKPYVTTVGLYDDGGNMVAVAKLSTPLQLPDNVDTTIIVRYDN
jgi:hypothetical protein